MTSWAFPVLDKTYKLVRFLYSAVYISLAKISLAIKRKKIAFLQLPVLEPIFSATWVVLILALKINVLKEMTFNLTTTVGLHLAACLCPNRKLKSLELLWWEKCKIAASSATVPVFN